MTSALHVAAAYRALRAGGVIAYPTEAVWGLGCDPFNAHAVRSLRRLKRRERDNGLILIASSFEQVAPLMAPLPTARLLQMRASWPGPVTWVAPAAAGVPDWVRGPGATVALRVTAHPLAAALCYVFGAPVVSSSANISGRPPARTALAVRRQLGAGLDYVLPGAVGGRARPSTLRDARDGRVLRP
jgi:L-threonylcarbamoyladenylate synthase